MRDASSPRPPEGPGSCRCGTASLGTTRRARGARDSRRQAGGHRAACRSNRSRPCRTRRRAPPHAPRGASPPPAAGSARAPGRRRAAGRPPRRVAARPTARDHQPFFVYLRIRAGWQGRRTRAPLRVAVGGAGRGRGCRDHEAGGRFGPAPHPCPPRPIPSGLPCIIAAMAQDLRGYLDAVKRKRPDELRIVSQQVDPAYEITALVVKLEREARRRPVLIFENVKGTRFPVMTNLHASRGRLALALGTLPDGLLRSYLRAMDRP